MLSGEIDFIGSLAGITGVLCVVLVAKGNIANYFFGVVNVSLYAYISFKSELYGDALLNALYYLPMQFIGWFMWIKKRQSSDPTTVKTKRMNLNERLVLALVSLVATAICGYALDYFGDPYPYKDAATTVLSIIAMFLMVRTYMEQWVLWVCVNVISIVIWIYATVKGEQHAALMVIMWCVYLANSINGWVNWYRLSKN